MIRKRPNSVRIVFLVVVILNQNKNKEEDLVQLNLDSSFENKRKISIKKKENTEKSIKTLSKNEIKDIKNKIAATRIFT